MLTFVQIFIRESMNRRIPNGSCYLFREPDSTDINIKPLILDPDTVNDLRVVGEFVGIIG
jgi:hypothetical protein